MANTDESQPADDQIAHSRSSWWTRFVGYVKSKLQQRKAKKEHETPTDRAARLTAIATVWMAAFTFILAGTSGFTIWILKNQLREMHEGGIDTHALSEATVDMANAASDQADAASNFSDTAEDINERMSDAVDQLSAASDNARRSIQATQNAMRLDQRAWVVWRGTEGVPELDKPWIIKTHFTNSGKTPAKNVRVNCSLMTVKEESAVDFNRIAQSEPTPTIIAPNDPTIYCALHPLTIEKVTQEILDTFSGKQVIVVVYGFATYNDIFGKEHWLTFCHAMESNGIGWNACVTHNDTGDGKLPKWQRQQKKAN